MVFVTGLVTLTPCIALMKFKNYLIQNTVVPTHPWFQLPAVNLSPEADILFLTNG